MIGFILAILVQGSIASTHLHIGDSLTAGPFGRALYKDLSENAQKTWVIGSCGMSPDAYLKGYTTPCGYLEITPGGKKFYYKKRKTPLLKALVKKEEIASVTIQLGTNQIERTWKPSTRPFMKRDIKALASLSVELGLKCIWVSPPDSRSYSDEMHETYWDVLESALHEVLVEKGKTCEIFDSRVSALPYLDFERLEKEHGKRGDGIHFRTIGKKGIEALEHWASDVANTVLSR